MLTSRTKCWSDQPVMNDQRAWKKKKIMKFKLPKSIFAGKGGNKRHIDKLSHVHPSYMHDKHSPSLSPLLSESRQSCETNQHIRTPTHSLHKHTSVLIPSAVPTLLTAQPFQVTSKFARQTQQCRVPHESLSCRQSALAGWAGPWNKHARTCCHNAATTMPQHQ